VKWIKLIEDPVPENLQASLHFQTPYLLKINSIIK